MGAVALISRYRSWVVKGGWALVDQALFSGANFLVNILLARWLPPKEYGAFAVAFSVFYLLAGFHTAIITEPMMVFGAGKWKDQFREYLSILLYGHFILSGLIVLLLGGTAAVMYWRGLQVMGRTLIGLAFSIPFLLLLWLSRRGCYIVFKPQWSVRGSFINLFLIIIGLIILLYLKCLSSFAGILLLGVAAMVSSIYLVYFLFKSKVQNFTNDFTTIMVVKEHWQYGKWLILESLVYISFSHLIMFIITFYLGLSGGAAWAAIRNLFRPAFMFIQAIGLILLPGFVKELTTKEVPNIKVFRVKYVIVALMTVYSLIMFIYSKKLLAFFYNKKYNNYYKLIYFWGIILIIYTLAQVSIIGLKSFRKVNVLPLIWGGSGFLVLFISLILIKFYKLYGVGIAYIIGYSVVLFLSSYFLRKIIYKTNKTRVLKIKKEEN